MRQFEWHPSGPSAARLWIDGEETNLKASLVHRHTSDPDFIERTERLILGMVREELGRYYDVTAKEKNEIVKLLWKYDDNSTD